MSIGILYKANNLYQTGDTEGALQEYNQLINKIHEAKNLSGIPDGRFFLFLGLIGRAKCFVSQGKVDQAQVDIMDAKTCKNKIDMLRPEQDADYYRTASLVARASKDFKTAEKELMNLNRILKDSESSTLLRVNRIDFLMYYGLNLPAAQYFTDRYPTCQEALTQYCQSIPALLQFDYSPPFRQTVVRPNNAVPTMAQVIQTDQESMSISSSQRTLTPTNDERDLAEFPPLNSLTFEHSSSTYTTTPPLSASGNYSLGPIVRPPRSNSRSSSGFSLADGVKNIMNTSHPEPFQSSSSAISTPAKRSSFSSLASHASGSDLYIGQNLNSRINNVDQSMQDLSSVDIRTAENAAVYEKQDIGDNVNKYCGLFITNISREITFDDLLRNFGSFGEIVDHHINPNADPGAYAFVTYKDWMQAEKAAKAMHGHANIPGFTKGDSCLKIRYRNPNDRKKKENRAESLANHYEYQPAVLSQAQVPYGLFNAQTPAVQLPRMNISSSSWFMN